MTPLYASPEMLLGEPITTATDVYGLGMLLYELLTGHHPHRKRDERTPDLRDAILRRDPPLASRACDDRFRRRLLGDLDQIIDKALRKVQSERYRSVDELAEDIRRHLDDRPIEARSPTFGYRLRKLRRRRRTLVAPVALIFSLVIGVLVMGAMYTVAARRHAQEMADARDRAELLKKRALEESATANRVSDFLVKLFEVNVPGQADRQQTTARTLLDRGTKRVGHDLADQPTVMARLLRTMGQAYEELGVYDEAVGLVDRELEIYRGMSGAEVETGSALARQSMLSVKRGDYEEARALGMESLRVHRSAPSPDAGQIAKAHIAVGWASGALGETNTAQAHFQKALVVHESLEDDADCEIGASLNGLAITNWRRGRTATARAQYERLLETCEGKWPRTDPRAGHALNNLAIILKQAGELELALSAYRRGLALREEILEPDHPDIAESLGNMAWVLLEQKSYVAAHDAATRSLDIRRRVFGPEHERVATSLTAVGSALVGLGRQREARPHLQRALSIFEKEFGIDGRLVSFPLIGLARADIADGRWASAEKQFIRAIEIHEKGDGDDHPDTVAARREYEAFLRRRP